MLALVINANARRVRDYYRIRDPFWEKHLPSAQVFITGDLNELDAAICAIRKLNVKVLACLGGDGSFHHLVNGCLRHLPASEMPVLVPLGGGTIDGIAKVFGDGSSPETTLQALLANRPVTARSLRLLQVTRPESGLQHYGFTFASGLAAKAVDIYNNKPSRGPLAVIAVCLAVLVSAVTRGPFFAPAEIAVSLNGEDLPAAPHTVVAGVLERPFLWFRPFGPQQPSDDAFRLLLIAVPPRTVALHYWAIVRGRYRHAGIRAAPAQAVLVNGKSGYVLDGERFFPDEAFQLEITAGPAVQIMDQRGSLAPGGR